MRATLQKVCAILCAGAVAFSLANAAGSTQTNLTGVITAVCPGEFVLQGQTGRVWIDSVTNSAWRLGDTVSVIGVPATDLSLTPKVMPAFTANRITVLTHGSVTPKATMPAELASGKYDYEQVQVFGVVTDAFRDEIDPDFVFVIIEADGAKAVSTFRDLGKTDTAAFESLIDTFVSATGMCVTHYMDGRHNMKRFLWLNGFPDIQKANSTNLPGKAQVR